MGSKHLQTRETQRERFQRQFDARRELLKGNGLADSDIAKDPLFKAFKAKLKQLDGAIARIGAIEEKTKKLQEKKERKKAEAEAAKADKDAPKGKKGAEEKKKAKGKGDEKTKKVSGGKKGSDKGGQKKKKDK